MEKPKVRYLEVVPLGDKYLLNDPFGITESIVVSPHLLMVMSLMDGTRDENEIKAEFFRRTGMLLTSEDYRRILKQLDELGLLLNETFERKLKEKKEEMLKEGVKKSFHAGEAFPSDPEELKKFIDSSMKKESDKRKAIGILVPHMDLRVAIDTYTKVYSRLDINPELVVILGVSHYFHEMPFSVCPLDFETPLGILETDRELVERLKREFEFDITHDILSYQKEHSIEFQTIFIKRLYPDAKILPVIVSYGDEKLLKDIADRISKVIDGKNVLVISSVDMSHVGKKFGDPASYDPSFRDKEYISLLEKLDSYGSFNLLKSDNNRTRIDGQFTNFVFIEVIKNLGASKGEEIDYQIYHEEPTDSKVSYAGMIFT